MQNDTSAGSDIGEASPYGGPGGPQEGNPAELWGKYCVGNLADPAVVPGPNYGQGDCQLPDPRTMEVAPGADYGAVSPQCEINWAAKVLTEMNPHSFALYHYINKHYLATPVKNPGSVSLNGQAVQVGDHAHQFLTYLCGEFRDRPTMVRAKLRWIHRTNYLPVVGQKQTTPEEIEAMRRSKNVWMHMRADWYQDYLNFSMAYFSARQKAIQPLGKVTFGKWTGIDRAVPAQTVCATKVIFAEYIAQQRPFDSLESFNGKLAAFEQNPEFCTQSDRDSYYDFRGDGNFKPNSPESNGMIWHANSLALQCQSPTVAITTRKKNSDGTEQKLFADPEHLGSPEAANDKCAAYFREPFKTRWNGARAGLGSWTLHAEKHDATFKNSNETVTIWPKWKSPVDRRPHSFALAGNAPGEFRGNWADAWPVSTFKIYEITGAADDEGTQEFVYSRLRNAVDRHTDWYNSGYDDGLNQGRARDQAYSPFVASSYEMKASDAFTAPCYTIPCTGDVPARHWKHYMFVFRVHKDRWFTTDRLDCYGGGGQGCDKWPDPKSLDFDTMWFDETSFGTTGLAKAERAFDRLGTALEDELDSILYLHHICSGGNLEMNGSTCH